jgi:pimeloyl-ACP methyl ester carboxylesterase
VAVKLRVEGGGELAYADAGRGEALLLLHAFPLAGFMWQPQVDALSDRLRVLHFDARGFGGSTPLGRALTMDRIADDAALLLDELGIERATVGGCSMGGYAALAFARRHAARLRRLVLIDTRAGADTDEARAGRAALAERVLAEGATPAADAFLPRLVGEYTRREQPALVERLRERILAAAPRGIADALHGLAARPDSLPTLAQVAVPTLVLVGAEDVVTPVAEAQVLADGIAGAGLEVVAGAGHLASLEQPAAVNAALARFLLR